MSAVAVTPTWTLASLLDVEAMTARLQSLVGPADVTVVEATVLDHKPGHRATVRYGTIGPSGPADIFGKTYANPAEAGRVHLLLSRLAACSERAPSLSVQLPLAVDPHVGLLLYTPVTGRTMDTLPTAPELLSALERAARWLVMLHRSGLQLDRTFDVAHESAAAVSWAALVSGRHPETATSATRLAAALHANWTETRLDVATPIHKDFQYQHVIVGDRVGVIDLDEARMGDATFDLAHFVANLHLLALRTGTSSTDRNQWRDTFLGTYSSITGVRADADTFAWCTGYSCLKLAKQIATGRGPRPRPRNRERAAQIAMILAEGLKCLER
jgi:hypothetical protein